MRITLQQAQAAIAAALTAAESTGERVSVAVIDAGGHLIAFARMDRAGLASLETALGKAFASVSTGAPTVELAPLIQPGQPLFGMTIASSRSMVMMAGGLPVEFDGELIGAIGTGGARSSGRDHEISVAGLTEMSAQR